ncbi:hypothetical protein SAMN05444166_1482 [Singulisphaera sp. GP187]|uniref:lysylphosphatidylglycerol synthase transmembrane domain-containing protein n=1 Tax=Singulisphaera sp. GP187 TaxID=1882752 RepID=UPI0009267624|nr:YbhN family protein [Singulisphaera sp. GP187]SIN89375.1 hypothetical protein SAMN05444166_1482 [Singulisphaera sp. GP187]
MIKPPSRPSILATTTRQRFDAITRLGKKRSTKLALKTLLGLVVLWTVGRHVRLTWIRLHERGGELRVEPAWIVASMGLYLAGLTLFGVFFDRIMKSSPTPVRLGPAVRAYLISHLGKYVPGKALVVVMRVGLMTPYGARAATAAFATLYETLVMMAGGAMVATLGFLVVPLEWWPVLIGASLSVALLVVVDPKVFPRISALVSVPFKGVGPDALPRFSRRLLAEGLLYAVGGWILLGFSQIAVICAVTPAGVPAIQWPLVIGSVALATVAGFAVAILPGGLGVREGILMATLQPALGADTAVVAALALRLTWLIGELLVAAVLSLIRPRLPVVTQTEVPVS